MKSPFLETGLISVIIPLYNTEKYIAECLQSVINQQYKKLEIIVVDDNSNDHSIQQAEFALKDSIIPWKIIKHEKNKGVSAARNTGVNNSHGEYLFFLDADDYLDSSSLKKLYAIALQNQSDMVIGTMMRVNCNGQKTGYANNGCNHALENRIYHNPIIAYVENKLSNLICNRLIHHQFFLQAEIPFKEGIRYEDNVWTFSITTKSSNISTISDITYYYRNYNENFMHNYKKLNAFRLDCLYYDINNCNNLSYNLNINNHPSYRIWFARRILEFFERIVDSPISQKEKSARLKIFFNEISIPNKELNKITHYLYAILNKLSFFIPYHYWINILIKIRSFKNRATKVTL